MAIEPLRQGSVKMHDYTKGVCFLSLVTFTC